MKSLLKKNSKKQQISNEELQEKIYKATKKPFHTNSAMKKELKEFSKV